jgi:hypothetical protein
MDADSENARLIRMAMRVPRCYAPFFQYRSGDKETMEIGVVESLMESMVMRSAETLTALKSRGRDDPPDCEAVTSSGSRVGIEVIELVDEAAIKADIAGARFAYAIWGEDKLLKRVEDIVHGKDVPADKIKGGPYDGYWLVIHCDETAVAFEETRVWIDRMTELRTNLVSRAILIFGYRPEHGCCPYMDLPTRQEQGQHVNANDHRALAGGGEN